jgi:hypothetical protein
MKRLNDDPRSLLSLRLDGEAVESSATVRQVHSTFLSHYEPQFRRCLTGCGRCRLVIYWRFRLTVMSSPRCSIWLVPVLCL